MDLSQVMDLSLVGKVEMNVVHLVMGNVQISVAVLVLGRKGMEVMMVIAMGARLT